MKVTFDYLDEFERGAKALRKKYPSFENDYDTFLNELEANPFAGESLQDPSLRSAESYPAKLSSHQIYIP